MRRLVIIIIGSVIAMYYWNGRPFLGMTRNLALAVSILRTNFDLRNVRNIQYTLLYRIAAREVNALSTSLLLVLHIDNLSW